MNAETTADEKEPVENVSTNLSDPHVVRGLFELAAQEVLFRLIAVSGGRMKADQARDMGEALAKHLARALMGENPQFRAVPGWSGIACARSLAAADRAFYETYFPAGTPEPDNPRALMVQATTVFYRAVYAAIRTEIVKDGATQESVRAAMAQVVERYALAAMPSPAACA